MDVVDIALSSSSIIISVGASLLIARKYGDVAGTNAAIEFEKEKAARARTIALQSLLNEVVRINDVVKHNSELNPTKDVVQSVLKMPVIAFETAFFSPEPVLLDEGTSESSELLNCVTAYLTKASSINVLAEIYLRASGFGSSPESRWGRTAVEGIVNKSRGLSDILKQLGRYLRSELAEVAA